MRNRVSRNVNGSCGRTRQFGIGVSSKASHNSSIASIMPLEPSSTNYNLYLCIAGYRSSVPPMAFKKVVLGNNTRSVASIGVDPCDFCILGLHHRPSSAGKSRSLSVPYIQSGPCEKNNPGTSSLQGYPLTECPVEHLHLDRHIPACRHIRNSNIPNLFQPFFCSFKDTDQAQTTEFTRRLVYSSTIRR
jgi:hypothetical protein